MMPLDTFLERMPENPPLHVPVTAVFMTSRLEGSPPMLLHHLEHNQVLHEQVVLLTVVTQASKESHYLVACLVRGGVFSGEGKEDRKVISEQWLRQRSKNRS